MAATEFVLSNDAPAPIGPYSQAVKAKGEFLFISGQIPLDAQGDIVSDDISEQTHQVCKNLQAVVQAAGYELRDIVKTGVFLMDMNDFAAMNAVYEEYFGESKPARAAVEVARLPKSAAIKVEIEAIAVR